MSLDPRRTLDGTPKESSNAEVPVASSITRRDECSPAPAGSSPSDEVARTLEETLASVEECRVVHDGPTYFVAAEPYMQGHWEGVIYPLIRDADFTSVLELAPGHGRNTVHLARLAGEIHLVDVTQSCLDACHARLGDRQGECRVYYHRNDGLTLPFIPDATITFIYSWDAAVHFDKEVLRSYIREFARVLAPGGTGFVHHSNYGAVAPN